MASQDPEQKIRELEAQLEDERQRSRFLDALLRSVKGGVTAVDGERRQTFVNRAFADMVGWEPEELLGEKPPFVYWAPEIRDRIQAVLADIVATGRRELACDWVFQRKSGERFDVAVRTSALLDAEGRQLGWCASMTDITERERLRSELVASADERHALQGAIEAAGEAIFLTDREGVFTYVNPRFTEIYGWKPDEVVGKVTPRILKSGLLGPEVYQAFWSSLLSGVNVRGRITNRARDGRLVRVESSSAAVRSEAGALSGFLAIQSDVTESEQLAQQLLQAQKMEAVGRLAGGVAHDFNNLLSVILNYAGFVLEELPHGDSLRADIEEIHRAGERAGALTRQLLLLSRQDAKRTEILDLGEVVSSTEKILRRTIGEDIDLGVERGTDLAPIRADLGNLTQVLMNLAVNARDAMPQGGRLEIRTGNRMVSEDTADASGVAAGPYVALEVCDTGCGMPPEVLSRAFEPFFTTKEAGKGTGLGLSIVLRVVRDLGGTVTVTSELGKGTRFCLLLPATSERPSRVSDLPPPDAGSGRTVLIVEDDDAVRAMTRRILTRSGYSVLEASNAGEALLVCEKDGASIDVLLSDIVMPKVSGPEIAARLRALRPKMKVVFMSGYPDAVRPEELEASGAGFIRKPFSRAELITKLGEIERGPPSSPGSGR